MNPRREHALRLRIEGKSYNEIQKEIKVSKSTLSSWLHDVVLSDKARARLDGRMREEGAKMLIKMNKLQTKTAEERASVASEEGKNKIHTLVQNDLLVIGAVLYWAEGYKRLQVRGGRERMGHKISFVNSDAEMIAVFIRFLLETLKVPSEKIRLTMRLYAHINERDARAYWMRATGLSSEHFYKTTYLVSGASKGVRPYNRLPWGTLQVEVCNTSQFHHLLGMISGVKEALLHVKMPVLPR